MFLAICIESLNLSPEQVLNSDFVFISSILREQSYIATQRNKQLDRVEENELDDDYIEMTDFETGKKRKVKRVKYI